MPKRKNKKPSTNNSKIKNSKTQTKITLLNNPQHLYNLKLKKNHNNSEKHPSFSMMPYHKDPQKKAINQAIRK